MGVKWSDASKQRYNGYDYIVKMGTFPDNKAASDKLWNYHRANKELLRSDGFITFKNGGQWEIKYSIAFNKVNLEKDESGTPKWKIAFNEKVEKYEKLINAGPAASPKGAGQRKTFGGVDANDYSTNTIDLADIEVNWDVPTN